MPRHFEVNEDDPAARDFFVALNHVVFSKVLAQPGLIQFCSLSCLFLLDALCLRL